MAVGRVLKFDEARGYGFVGQEDGGEDVFIHVNDLDFDKSLLATGARVEFEIEESGRGLKASAVQLLEQAPEYEPPARTGATRSPDDGLCDVLTAKEFTEEVTELLLASAPGLTGEQILRVRQHLVRMAHAHGWVDG